MPVVPACHGIEYSPVGSDGGLNRLGTRFLEFGILSSGSFSNQPRLISRAAIQYVGAIRFGPIGLPADRSGWILAKYSLLSL